MGSTKVSAPPPQPVPKKTTQELEIERAQLSIMKKQSAQLDAMAPLFAKQLQVTERQLDSMIGNEDFGEEQIALQREEVRLARESIQNQKDLAPFILEGYGLKENDDGSLRRLTEDEFAATLSDTEKVGRENLLLSLERERKALLGELPLSESGQQQKADEFSTFKEAMSRAGHVIEGDDPETAVATTTAGIQSLKAFNERFGLLEDAERRGELTQGAQAVLARTGVASDLGARRMAGLVQFPLAASGLSTSAAGLVQGLGMRNVRPDYGAAAGQYSGLLQPYQFGRSLEAKIGMANAERSFAASQQSAANKAAMWSGLMEAGGAIAGAAAGAHFGKTPAGSVPKTSFL